MSNEPKYWFRALRSGGFEFYMAVSGNTMKGRVPTLSSLKEMRETFESQTGAQLPVPEKKPMRGKR